MKRIYFLLFSIVFVACSKEETKTETTTASGESTTQTTAPPATTPVATTRYAANDALYVLATSGLNLRDKADANGTKITNVPYGSTVKVLAEDLGKTAYSVEEIKGFKIEGYWVKVDFGGKIGYLFDGFLSKWAAPKNDAYDFATYLDKACKKVKSDKNKPKKADPRDADIFEYEHIEYADGTQFTTQAYEGGANDKIIFGAGKITLPEAYLLMKALTKGEKTGACKYDASKKYISCESEMELVEVGEENGHVFAKFSVAD